MYFAIDKNDELYPCVAFITSNNLKNEIKCVPTTIRN